MMSFFPRGVLGEIWGLTELVSGGFPTNFYRFFEVIHINDCSLNIFSFLFQIKR